MLSPEIDVERLGAVCQRYGIIRLEIFGSMARGTDHPDSDVDLLYTLAPGARLGWEIEDLTSELEAVLGRRVDHREGVARAGFHPRAPDVELPCVLHGGSSRGRSTREACHPSGGPRSDSGPIA